MDVRDLFFWAAEANRRSLARRMEAFCAGLLPHESPETVRTVMGDLMASAEALDQDADEIDRADKENARLIAEANLMMKAKRERRRAQRAAGIKPAAKKRRRGIPRKAKVIR
jgi:hypothetical protein